MHQVFKMDVASFTDTELLSVFSFETIHKVVMAVKSVNMLYFIKASYLITELSKTLNLLSRYIHLASSL